MKTFFLISILCIYISDQSSFAQNIRIKGKVIEIAGSPLPRVKISVIGTQTFRTNTSSQGYYSIDAPCDGKLEYSCTGYMSQIVDINNQCVIDVIMEVDAKILNEIVVFGYSSFIEGVKSIPVITVNDDKMIEVFSPYLISVLQRKNNEDKNNKRGNINIKKKNFRNRSLTDINEPKIIVKRRRFYGNISDIPSDIIESIDIKRDKSALMAPISSSSDGTIIIRLKHKKDLKLINPDLFKRRKMLFIMKLKNQ